MPCPRRLKCISNSAFPARLQIKRTLFKRVETQIVGATVTDWITLGVVSVFKNHTKAVRRLHEDFDD